MLVLILLGELLDPSTSFIRSGVKVPTLIVDHWSHDAEEAVASRDVAVDSESSSHSRPSHSTLETDQIHYACVAAVPSFELCIGAVLEHRSKAGDGPEGHVSTIFQPPRLV